MIAVEITADGRGRLVSCRASGHAGAGMRGEDPVCAAVSVLLRTVMEQLSGSHGVDLSVAAEKRGDVAFSVSRTDSAENTGLLLEYAASFLAGGIGSVSRDFPEYVKLTVHTAHCV